MPAHIRFARVDERPVGFSRFWLQDILRGKMGFENTDWNLFIGGRGKWNR